MLNSHLYLGDKATHTENVEICCSLNSEELHRYQVAVPHEKNSKSLKVPTQ